MDIGSANYATTEKTILDADFQNCGQSCGNWHSDPEMPREADLRKLLPPAGHSESRGLSSESCLRP